MNPASPSSSLPPPTLATSDAVHPHFEPPPEPPKPHVELRPIEVPVTAQDWRDMLWDALTYAGRRDGLVILGAASLLCAIPFLGAAMAFAVLGYGLPYYLRIIEETINGRDDPPNWPAISNFRDSVLEPVVALGAIGLFGSLPLLVFLYAQGLPLDDSLFDTSSVTVVILHLYRVLYIPMATLRYAVFDNLGSAMPWGVFPSVFRMWWSYLLVVVIAFLIDVMAALAQSTAALVPVVGWFIGSFVGMYLMLCHGRLLGLFYRQYQSRLGW